jgi:hypothetical protein
MVEQPARASAEARKRRNGKRRGGVFMGLRKKMKAVEGQSGIILMDVEGLNNAF